MKMETTLDHWIDHFARNSHDRPEPDWAAPVYEFDAETKALLLESLQQFQLGDGGGPAYLIGRDLERYFARHPGMKRLIDLWFKEEERHSQLLGKAVARLGGKPITQHWSFSVFCWVRKCFGVRFELYALLLTEITSNNYYKLLRKHARDPALVAMAELIIRDETGHISFHRDRMALKLENYYRLGNFWALTLYLLALAAGSMLWLNHRRPLVRLGATTLEFYRSFLQETARFIYTTRRRRKGRFNPQELAASGAEIAAKNISTQHTAGGKVVVTCVGES